MGAFYLLWNRINFFPVNNFYQSFCFPLTNTENTRQLIFQHWWPWLLQSFLFSWLQVISPPSHFATVSSPPILLVLVYGLKERGILHLKRACFALWLIERGILLLKHAKWLENRGLRNRGELTGYLFLSSSPFIVFNFSCLGKGEKNVLQDLAAGSPHPQLSTYYPISSEAYTEHLITLTCLAAKIWQKSSVTRLYEK